MNRCCFFETLRFAMITQIKAGKVFFFLNIMIINELTGKNEKNRREIIYFYLKSC